MGGGTDRLTYFFDGGCRPNPGPIEVAVVHRGRSRFRDDLGDGDNDEAEWLALLFAVELAIKDRAADALFVGDSVLIVEQASGRWPCRTPKLEAHLRAFRDATAAIPRVRLRWVRRSHNLAGIALARRAPR